MVTKIRIAKLNVFIVVRRTTMQQTEFVGTKRIKEIISENNSYIMKLVPKIPNKINRKK